MITTTGLPDEADRLFAALDANTVNPLVLESGFKDYSVESKNTLVKRLADFRKPLPPGRALGRLPFVLTPANRADMEFVFQVNLQSPVPDARVASLYGLQQLGYPRLPECAEQALKDESDDVLVAACSILLPRAQNDPRLRQRLQQLRDTNRYKPHLYASNELLKAHGFA